MKSEVDKLDFQRLVPVPTDLSKLSNVVKNEVVKKTEYDELVKNVIAIKTSGTTNLVKKADYDTKTGEIQTRILDHKHDKYIITTQEFNKLTTDNFAARLKEAK